MHSYKISCWKPYDYHMLNITKVYATETRSLSMLHSVLPRCSSKVRLSPSAIKYMENSCNKDVRDYNYNQMRRLEQQNRHLMKLLTPANNSSDKLAKSWFLAVRYMSYFSEQIKNTAAIHFSLGQDIIDGIMGRALSTSK